MNVYRANEIPQKSTDFVCRNSIAALGIASVITLVLTGVVGYWAWFQGINLILFCSTPLLLLYAGFCLVGFVRSLAPTNWLLRWDDRGMILHLRSFLNAKHTLPDDVVAVGISRNEIAGVRAHVEREIVVSDRPQRALHRKMHWLEVRLMGDTAALQELLDRERQKKFPTAMGKSAWGHYPVQLDHDVLRIEWRGPTSRVVPPLLKAIEIISRSVPREPDHESRYDFRKGDSLPEDEAKIEDLARRGERIAAVKLARTVYGCSLSEANQRVDAFLARKTGEK